MKLDILAFGAHPDDVELSAAGVLISHINHGYKCGIVDLTRGELGTRGDADTRDREAAAAAQIMGISVRENLGMDDGFFTNDKEHQLEIVKMIRKYQPEIILCNAESDRHPDHGRASGLVSNSVFLAGLPKVETSFEEQDQKAWKVKSVYHYIQDRFLKPDVVVDISLHWDQKMDAIQAYKTQFYQPGAKGPQTAISTKEFLDFLAGRSAEMGRPAGFKYAEGFTVERYPGVKDLFNLH